MNVRKPRLTDRVLNGIIAACSVILAGTPSDAFGHSSPENDRDFDDVGLADRWAKAMQDHRAQQKEKKAK
jgi:hypothetical protein